MRNNNKMLRMFSKYRKHLQCRCLWLVRLQYYWVDSNSSSAYWTYWHGWTIYTTWMWNTQPMLRLYFRMQPGVILICCSHQHSWTDPVMTIILRVPWSLMRRVLIHYSWTTLGCASQFGHYVLHYSQWLSY